MDLDQQNKIKCYFIALTKRHGLYFKNRGLYYILK